MVNKGWLFYSMLLAFLAWLAVIFIYLLPRIMADPESIDPMMTLVAGLGVGGVTQFFILLLKDAWQFFFRKSPSGAVAKDKGGAA